MIDSFVAIDLETTGLSPREDHIIEIGAVKFQGGKIVEEYSQLINPPISIPKKISNLTGITDDMVEGKPLLDVALVKLIDFLGENVLIGHNIMFDYGFLKEAYYKNKRSFSFQGIDTLHLCRILHKNLDSRTLGSMCSYYGILLEKSHRALEDARAAGVLYYKLVEEFVDWEEDWFSAKELQYKVKKTESITGKQKKYLIDLLKYHKIDMDSIDSLTKSQASQAIDRIILNYGRIM